MMGNRPDMIDEPPAVCGMLDLQEAESDTNSPLLHLKET